MQRIDAVPRVLDWETFCTFADHIIAHTRRRRGDLSLLLVALDRTADADVQAAAVEVIADRIVHCIRGGDVAGRHGPTSFAILAQDAPAAGALRLAERIRGALPTSVHLFGGAVPFTASIGIAVLPHADSSMADLAANGEQALAESIRKGGNTVTTYVPQDVPDLPQSLLSVDREAEQRIAEQQRQAALRSQTLSMAARALERGSAEALAIKARTSACAAVLDAAREHYQPDTVPSLPLADCTAPWDCSCTYGAVALDGYRRPASPSSLSDRLQQIPRRWRDAARFGSDPKYRCSGSDLAAYLDSFALLPIAVDVPLEAGEEVYLRRPARRAWERQEGAGPPAMLGAPFPLSASLSAWVRKAERPASVPQAALEQPREGTLYLSNQRLLFDAPTGMEPYRLADIGGVAYLREAVVCFLSRERRRVVFVVQDALQVGLCVAHAWRTHARP